MANSKKILFIGGHGKVGLLSTPKLSDRGHQVTSLIRNPDQVADIKSSGATALVRDATELSAADWAELAADFDVVVWSAGNGGKGGDDVTYAVDRDAAIASIDGLRQLKDSHGSAPRYVMVSYVGSLNHVRDNDDPMYAYTEAKKAADKHLLDTDLDFVILGPAALSMDPSRGLEIIENRRDIVGERTTSRELVADVIVEVAERGQLPTEQVIPFVDGDTAVSEI